jgi:thiol-disulfide isomerase/thioredoxin
LPQALNLLEEAEKLIDANAQNKQADNYYTESWITFVNQRIAISRADILLRLGRPVEALAILQLRKDEFTSGSSFYLYGEALEGTGNKRGAIAAYLDSVVRPSKYEKEANTAFQRLWSQQKLGAKKALQKAIDAKVGQLFSEANYVPHILSHPVPDFDLTTLRGERLTSAQLRGKRLIVNFWAVWCGPCRTELKPLQDFQEGHPNLIVLTVVNPDTDRKALNALVHEQKLTSLRIAEGTSEMRDRFGANGVPETFFIDEAGYVRIQHLGSVPDLPRYFEADLKAITDAGPVQRLVQSDVR